jgi:VCBS repeat-containing protein
VTYTDTFTVASADGTETSVTVNIFGANDGAVLSSADVAKNETNAPLTFDGQLSISDVDSDETFVAQSNEPGQYGQFSIDANGAWTYVADSAHNEFVAGQTYTDTFEVESADGTTTTVKVTINGTNDAAALSSADASKAETNAPLTFNGTLTIDDVDSQETFAAQTDTPGTYGKFSIDAGGNWTYTANSALDSLNPGQSASDAFDVFSADGTKTTVKITITGTADGPLVGPSPYEGTGDPSDATEIDKAAASAVTFNGSGNSADTVYGSNSVDNIDAKNGADKIYGFGGNDILKGGPGTDQIYGGAGDDVIDGDADDDALYGGSGADTIDGKGGSDTIVGGYGADSLTGGAQADVFVYLDAKDTGDTITNFGDVLNANGRFVNNDGDKIDLSALDAVTLGFTADKTSLSAHSVISFYDASAGKTIVQVDTDGNASTVELQIQLTGNIELVAGDFILT